MSAVGAQHTVKTLTVTITQTFVPTTTLVQRSFDLLNVLLDVNPLLSLVSHQHWKKTMINDKDFS